MRGGYIRVREGLKSVGQCGLNQWGSGLYQWGVS